ncbi:hypothetical protein EV128_11757 [Rhizobium azibense]|nr:hypothetical protein EV128_11757 [Rhizobium azibense]
MTGKIVGAMTGEFGAIRKADYSQAWGKDSTNLAEYDYYLRAESQLNLYTIQATFTDEAIKSSIRLYQIKGDVFSTTGSTAQRRCISDCEPSRASRIFGPVHPMSAS